MRIHTIGSTLATTAVLATTATLLVACGSSDSFADGSATSIRDASKKATTSVDSLHVTGELTNAGKQESIDLQLDDQGNCKGTLGIDSGTAEILGVGGTYWFKPDDAFWQQQAGSQADQIIALVGDKYVVNSSLSDVCDLDQFLAGDGSDKTTSVKNLGTATVDGQETVKIASTDDTGTSTGYVLTSDPHYLVKLEREGDEPGTFTLDSFGDDFDVTAPSADEQIDLDNAGG